VRIRWRRASGLALSRDTLQSLATFFRRFPREVMPEQAVLRLHHMPARPAVTKAQKETQMAELIVVGFKQDMHRASEVLNTLKDMNQSWVVDLQDAVAVYRNLKGKLRVDQSYQMTTGQGAAWGGLFGGLIGAILAAPFTAGASAAAGIMAAGSLSGLALGATFGAADAEDWKDDYGISEQFVNEVGSMVQPGDSAIFALLRTIDPTIVEAQFKGYGGTILRTTLNDVQRDKVEKTLHAR
jgi:uncharacterized membrane protein